MQVDISSESAVLVSQDSHSHAAVGSLIPVVSEESVSVMHLKKTSQDPCVVTTSEPVEHLAIIAEENVQGVIMIELHQQIESLAVEVFVGCQSSIRVATKQPFGFDALSVIQRSRLEEGAHIRWQNATMGGSNIQYDLMSELAGSHAESNVDWIFHAQKSDKHTLSARNVFLAKDGGGEILMKGVAEETAHVTCNGMIDIGLQGGGTDTYLTEDVLMLDSSAKVDAIPGLEIKTNDVKASHSATISKVTPEDLFYFAARGIPEETAREMYIEGFIGSILSTMNN